MERKFADLDRIFFSSMRDALKYSYLRSHKTMCRSGKRFLERPFMNDRDAGKKTNNYLWGIFQIFQNCHPPKTCPVARNLSPITSA